MKKNKTVEEFKKFALKGNMIDLAVGVIIGGAFNGIVLQATQYTKKEK